MSVVPSSLALKSLWHATAVNIDSGRVKKAQKEFLEACEKQGHQQISELSEKIPLSEHVKGYGVLHNRATMPILGGVATSGISDALNNGWYNPVDNLGAMHGDELDWRGGVFDEFMISVGDTELNTVAPMRRYRTTKVFRIEIESGFLDKEGMFRFETNGRLFPGIGGSIIKSPDTAPLVYRPEDEAIPAQLKNAVLYLVGRDVIKKKEAYSPKLLEYRDAVADLGRLSKSYPALHRLRTKSFRVVTSNPDRMLRHISHNSYPSPVDVLRVDITKTSSGCPQPLTFVIPVSNFTKASLRTNISEKITAQELKRLFFGPVSMLSLSQAGIDSIQVRCEPVRRLRQTREVSCSRRLVGDTYHGRYTEYLAEFSDGSTSWIPSCNVADDLKQEFWDVLTTGAEEVAEIVDSDTAKGKLTVKRADGLMVTMSQALILWQPEVQQAMLSDAELEAILHHAHFGVDYHDFIPCQMLMETDWARVELLHRGTIIMKDPAAQKAGEYADVHQDSRSLQVSESRSFKFTSRTIPFLIANNGASFDIRVTHGHDNTQGEKCGRVTLTVRDERFESVYDHAKKHCNASFHIRPVLVTPGLLCIETNWGAIEVTSTDATIGPDPTVDQSTYQGVVFNGRSMEQRSGVFGEKFVIPFLLFTRDEQVDIAITHGADKGPDRGDCSGAATAMFAQGAYTSPCDMHNQLTNLKVFRGCKVSVNVNGRQSVHRWSPEDLFLRCMQYGQ
ncbi:hypothetical protein FOMPIDRAFT_114099 [Fomitopsis schrenkii]|uniref:Uncharacterized protein n=1 Tax=Fomitopsis schrenkii TaxID=2126942 RepID=S8EH70_FOMSC|nr:hypothetical protein FOMPIDRAFT_114099 [Fomitopsis schrenkii]